MLKTNANGPLSSDNIRNRLLLFQGMVHCCFPVEFWEYDRDLNLLSPITPENELMSYFFRYSTGYSSLKEYLEKGHRQPALIHNREGLHWIADFEMLMNRIYLMGPFAMAEAARMNIRQNYEIADHPLEMHRRLNETLTRIPIIPPAYMFQYALMFHYALTGERIHISDIQRPFTQHGDGNIFAEEEEDSNTSADIRSHSHAGIWQMETALMQAVRTGNLEYRSYIDQVSVTSNGIRMREPGALRSGKDSVILFIGLCSRAAIAGGLPPEISYDMCDRYVEMAESTGSISELSYASNTMLEDYIRKVHSYQTDSSLSRPVRICCDYIHMHVSETITLQRLADVCGYTEYYLSRKFKKETGITPGEFILHAKLDQACLLLKTTSYSVQDISDSLAFSTRSYFSTAFQKYKGLSPKQYRESAGK